MSLVVDRPVSGPATHALVIGVPHYRHLPGGEEEVDLGMPLSQLQAPGHSARDVVAFLRDEYRNDSAPLATVELLLPPDAAEPGQQPEHPTMANVRQAVLRWFERCDGSPQDVAFFYFCGHGFEGAEQYLLLEDFGASRLAVLDNTLNVDRLHIGMGRCAARTQFFFVDACRELPRSLERALPGGGQSVLDPVLGGDRDRDAPILRAAAPGRKAFARRGQSTQFVQALLQALRGAGAVQDVTGGDTWSVRHLHLVSAVGQLLANTTSGRSSQRVRSGDSGDSVVHQLSGPPQVPVLIRSKPPGCVDGARLQLRSLVSGQCYQRDAADGPWHVVVVPDDYRLQAELQLPYSAAPLDLRVAPPMRICVLEASS